MKSSTDHKLMRAGRLRPLGMLVLLLILNSLAQVAVADVRLAQVFGDHMVLQREQPIRVWGWARAQEVVHVEFHEQRVNAVADAKGVWSVRLKPEKAGGPYVLIVRGEGNMQRAEDVLVGEVWICSGQSNMEWPLRNAMNGEREVALAAHPWLRHITVPKRTSLQALSDIEPAPWRVSTPASAGDFTAVGYFFAKQIHERTGVPVGLISMNWGGSQLEAWSSPESLAGQVDFAQMMRAMPTTLDAYLAMRDAQSKQLIQSWQQPLSVEEEKVQTWHEPQYKDARWSSLNAPQYWEEQGLTDFDGVVWYRRELNLSAQQANKAAVLHLGMIDDCDVTWVNGHKVGETCIWDQSRHYAIPSGVLHEGRNIIAVRVTDTGGGGGFHGNPDAMRLSFDNAESFRLDGAWKARVESPLVKTVLGPNDLPSVLFNGMVNPLLGYAMRGVIWYQGESNVPRAAQYAQTFALMIEDWRRRWGQGDFPFYFVQLASFLPVEKNSLNGSPWAELRESQRLALKLGHTGMAVTTDVGDEHDIHPRDKQTVGARLALHALKNDYGFKLIESGPMYQSMKIKQRAIELRFSSVGKGLGVRSKTDALQGFTIAGADRKFRPAQARIDGDAVVVWNEAVQAPLAMRYAWVDNPMHANLVNSDRLPASPFRTDDWPLLTKVKKYAF